MQIMILFIIFIKAIQNLNLIQIFTRLNKKLKLRKILLMQMVIKLQHNKIQLIQYKILLRLQHSNKLLLNSKNLNSKHQKMMIKLAIKLLKLQQRQLKLKLK